MSTQYPLGTADVELERLRFQHELWGPITRDLLVRAGLGPGARVLDLGAGPGLVACDAARAVGPAGRVVALDESPRWREVLEVERARRGLDNVEVVTARIEDARFDPGSFDLVFARWVFSFLPDPAAAARAAARWLAPGGALVLQDYNHEGISLFPPSEGFRAVVRGTRALYAASGGDAFVLGRATELVRAAGLELAELAPRVLCGGPRSAVWRWADLFFPPFAAVMEERGLVSPAERAQFLREWAERAASPDALFFSPIVLEVIGRKPARAA